MIRAPKCLSPPGMMISDLDRESSTFSRLSDRSGRASGRGPRGVGIAVFTTLLTSPKALPVTPVFADFCQLNQYDIIFINIADTADSPPYNRSPRSATSYSQPSRIPFSEGRGRRGPIAPAANLFCASRRDHEAHRRSHNHTPSPTYERESDDDARSRDATLNDVTIDDDR